MSKGAPLIVLGGALAAGTALGAGAGYYLSRPRRQEAPAAVPIDPSGRNATAPAAAAPSSAVPYLSRDILKYNATLPGPVADLLEHTAYVSAYDRRMRNPAWTAEHLTAQNLLRPAPAPGTTAVDRKFSVFKEDERIPAPFRARLADYFRSGYDRGHQVPASDAKRSQAAMDETFLLSNIAPQVGEGFNRDYWAYLEEYVRSLTRQFSDLYVFTIPLYLPQPDPQRPGKWRVSYEVIGNPPNVAVPTHFAKVVLAVDGPRPQPLPAPPSASPSPTRTSSAPLPVAGGTSFLGLRTGSTPTLALAAFVLPNAPIANAVPLRTFVVPLDAVERAAGLELFPDAIKRAARPLCDCVPCNIVLREWPDRPKPGPLPPGSSVPFPPPAFPPPPPPAPAPAPAPGARSAA